MKQVYFVAGLPRTGSTLLQNILSQNPRFYASPTSGLVEVMRGVRDGWAQVALFRNYPESVSLAKEQSVLRGILNSFYRDTDEAIIFDKSRAWPAYIETLKWILPYQPKLICCVRDVREIITSFELLHQKTIRSGMTSQQRAAPAEFSTLEGRCDFWVRGDQPLGSAFNVMKDALARGHKEHIHFVRYEDLAGHPLSAMAGIYDFLGEEPFEHQFTEVEQVIVEDDRLHGFVGLHDIRNEVKVIPKRWQKVLGEQIGRKFAKQEFWA